MTVLQILIVDDEPAGQVNSIAYEVEPDEAVVVVRHPRDIAQSDLLGSAVVAVDHYLEDWSELDSQPLAMQPANGFALAAVLRSQVDRSVPGPAIVILTGQLPRLAGPLPLKAAEHLLAWQHDVEWVFPKAGAAGDSVAPRLVAMAKAVEKLRRVWTDPFGLEALVTGWLGLKDPPWSGVARDHIVRARPPIHSVGDQTLGASVLRWFLQRVLPYPTFLSDVWRTAMLLGVATTWLESELSTESELCDRLDHCAYSGAFLDFSGRRWWRAGLANLVVELSDGQPFDREAIQRGVSEMSSGDPAFLSEARPILAVDPTTMESTLVVEAEMSVRIGPDGWPFYADNAWASKADVFDNPALADLVLDPVSPPTGPKQ